MENKKCRPRPRRKHFIIAIALAISVYQKIIDLESEIKYEKKKIFKKSKNISCLYTVRNSGNNACFMGNDTSGPTNKL